MKNLRGMSGGHCDKALERKPHTQKFGHDVHQTDNRSDYIVDIKVGREGIWHMALRNGRNGVAQPRNCPRHGRGQIESLVRAL